MPLALHRWFPAAKAPGTIDLYALSQAVGKAPKRAESAFGASFVGNEIPAEQETVAPPGVGSGASVSVGAVSIRSCRARADAG
jgi:hypothetical protein